MIDFDLIKADRRSWPFKDMKVGEVVRFTKEEKTGAQMYAHTLGRQKGMVFKTKTENTTGDLYVKRVK